MTSPFYPGTNFQFAWNSSALGVLKDCPRKYQYLYIEGWASKGESIHLRFGTLYHKGLELYDTYLLDGDEPEEALDKTVDYLLQATWDDREYKIEGDPTSFVVGTGRPWDTSQHPAGNKKNRETLIRSVVWYVEHFKDDPTQTVILENGKPALEMVFTTEINVQTPKGEPYLLTGHMDRLVLYGEDKFVMDRKTTGGGVTPYYFTKFNPDNQMSLYTFAARVVYDVPVSGVIIDAAQIAVGFTNFNRGITARSKNQLEDWLADTGHWLKAAEHYAEKQYWPMNDQSCHKYDGCVFRQVCDKDPAVRELYLNTHFERSTHNRDRILEPDE